MSDLFSKSVLIYVGVLLFLGVDGAAYASEPHPFTHNSVKIFTSYDKALNYKGEGGFGMIVGYRKDEYLIVTANHLIESNGSIGTVQIEYYDEASSKRATAKILEPRFSDSRRDIAFLAVKSNNKFIRNWNHLSQSERNVGDLVTFAAEDRQIKISGVTGKLIQVSNKSLEFVGLPIEKGVSGSALIGAGGVVGIIVYRQQSQTARATTVDFIKNKFDQHFKQHGWTWGLKYLPEIKPSGALNVLFIHMDGREQIRLLHESGRVTLLPDQERVSLPVGIYSVDVSRSQNRENYECSPGRFRIEVNTTFSAKFRCYVNLEGTWLFSSGRGNKFEIKKNNLHQGYTLKVFDRQNRLRGTGSLHLKGKSLTGNGDIRGFDTKNSLFNGAWRFEAEILTSNKISGTLKYVRDNFTNVPLTLRRAAK